MFHSKYNNLFKKFITMFQKDKFNNNAQNSYISDMGESFLNDSHANGEEGGKIKDGLWSQEEIFKFISYLIYNRQGLKLKLQRRTSKVFKQMAIFIGTRSSVQCRSQNQRLFRKYKNIRTIVSSFKEQYGRDRFEQDYSQIILNPIIKFKTQYENYLENNSKKHNDVATQTEQPTTLLSFNQYTVSPSVSGMEYFQGFNQMGANWIFLPYCS